MKLALAKLELQSRIPIIRQLSGRLRLSMIIADGRLSFNHDHCTSSGIQNLNASDSFPGALLVLF